MPLTSPLAEPTLFDELNRPDCRRAYIDGAWRTVRVLKRLPGGKLTVQTYTPKKGWRKLPKAIREEETQRIR